MYKLFGIFWNYLAIYNNILYFFSLNCGFCNELLVFYTLICIFEVVIPDFFDCQNLESVEDMFICKCILECIGDWTCGKKESAESIFSASYKLSVVVAIPKTAFETIEKEEKDYFITGNAVSIAYGKIRAVIENITAESIVGKQIIPTIDPYTFSISAKNAAKN